MKQKYILGIYDKLINEIKYNQKTTDSEIIAYLKNCAKDSYYIHQIQFSKQKDKIKYAIQQKIHNLHPYAPDFINVNRVSNPEFENLIPLILKELNIPDSNLEFHWNLLNEKSILIIKEPCKMEDVAPESFFFLYCYHTVKNENFKIKSALNEMFFSLKTEDRIELYVHRIQYALEQLSNTLFKEINPNTPVDIYSFSSNYHKIDCLKITNVYLEKLLIFIQKEYRNFLNVNIQVPYRTLLVNELEIVDKLNFVKSRLVDCNLKDDLFKLAYQPLLKIATINVQDKITYNEFNYCCEFINELYKHFQQNIENVSESDINGWLFDLNLNSLDFFDYKTYQIIKNLDTMESDIEKIDTLYQLLKGYNQRQRQSGLKFIKKLPSIKEQIISWIEEEIEYLSKKKKLLINNFQDNNLTTSRVKIQTSLSVAQLSYFFKLLMKAKIIIHKNQTEVFKFIADNFTTIATTNISAGSVKSKFHNIEAGAIKKIRAYIIELMNLTKL